MVLLSQQKTRLKPLRTTTFETQQSHISGSVTAYLALGQLVCVFQADVRNPTMFKEDLLEGSTKSVSSGPVYGVYDPCLTLSSAFVFPVITEFSTTLRFS